MNVEQLQSQIAKLQSEAEALTKKEIFTKADKSACDLKLSQIADLRSQLKAAQTTDGERRQRAREVMLQTNGPDALLSKEERGSIRSLLLTPLREERSYIGMSVATDSAGGYFVPQSFYDKLVFALKAADALWDDSVVTVVPTEHGNAMTLPFSDDTSAAATIVSENTAATESEIATIDRLAFGKVPTWRSGKLLASVELLQDSAFPVEEQIVVPATAKRIQRGVGAANVTTLLSSTTSGATSAASATVTVDDVLALLGSVDPAYLSSPKAFIGMNNTTLLSLLRQKSTTGSFIWKPKYDANGRPMLANVPVVILPSLPNVAASSKSVVAGDFSRCIRRQVSQVRVIRYEQAPNLAEQGIVAYQAFMRTDFGVLTSSSSDSPIKYLTTHA
jgi:HK97 family phage major capsid protein